MLKRFLLALFALCLLFTAAACKPVTQNENVNNQQTTTVYEQISKPTLAVDTTYTQGEDVVVKVNAKNNPGVLTLLLNIVYDEDALQLTKVESGNMMADYTFTGPKKLRSSCNAIWHTTDVPQNVTDGEVALLHFTVKDGIAPGEYEVSVTCNRGAYDSEYNEIPFENIKGYVIVNPTTHAKEESK